ncbi:Octopamine receptor in mushroom bodies [Carabus blaptoides fortunei]
MWLALDVWMCTASILNLCAISLDRYVAVTRPITYPSIMSHSRAKLLIAGLWVLSFVICFPPLVGWKDTQNDEDERSNSTNRISVTNPPCPWKCELTNEAGYVVYSALGSFYIPMFVMLFFYWRIYKAAVRTTRAINQGFRTTKGSRGLGSRFDEQRLTLRIHRGRGSVMNYAHGSPHSNGIVKRICEYTEDPHDGISNTADVRDVRTVATAPVTEIRVLCPLDLPRTRKLVVINRK